MPRIVKHSGIKIKKIPMKTDKILHHNLIEPLNNLRHGFYISINGSSGSGKTNLLMNLLDVQLKNNTNSKTNLNGVFDNIYLVGDTFDSLETDTFDEIDTKYNTLNDFLDDFDEIKREQIEEAETDEDRDFNLVILDDIADEIKTKVNLERFLKFVNKRRHYNTSIILLSQNLVQLPTGARKNLNILISFFPKSVDEEELLFTYIKQKKREMNDIFEWIYDGPRCFLMIDLTRMKGKTNYYKNFDRIEF